MILETLRKSDQTFLRACFFKEILIDMYKALNNIAIAQKLQLENFHFINYVDNCTDATAKGI